MSSLSIVIAAYNDARFLMEQLQAIVRQRILPTEVILVDDGSTDDTWNVMTQFVEHMWGRDRGARAFRLEENQGCAKATNRGVAEATGDWVYIASANDVVQPGAFRAFAEAVGTFPDARLITGDVANIHLGWGDEEGAVSTPSFLPPDRIARILGGAGIIHAAGTLIRRDAWNYHGGWNSDWWPYSETLTWHVTACRYGVVYTPNTIAWVRPHAGSASSSVLDREFRRPIMEMAAEFVRGLDEPERSRLINSNLWDIAEWAPDMRELLAEKPVLV